MPWSLSSRQFRHCDVTVGLSTGSREANPGCPKCREPMQEQFVSCAHSNVWQAPSNPASGICRQCKRSVTRSPD